MKKMFLLLTLLCLCLVLIGCSKSQNKLYILNWDEYIDEGLLDKFEEQFDCKVIMEIAESNEIMYSRISSKSADYDIAIPSDYMISQMVQEDMLYEIDFSSPILKNYDQEGFDDTLCSIIDRDCSDIKGYFVPYFWGSLGIMYNTDLISEDEFNEKIATLAANNKSAWNVLFEKANEANIGMYATSRDSIGAALLALGQSLNVTVNDINPETGKTWLEEAELLLKNMEYKGWATDDLKTGVAGGKYQMALVYSGDYIDALYSLDDPEDANFKMYTPHDANNVFFDAMVIPKTSHNIDLAYQFINFMIDTNVSEEDLEEYGDDAVSNAFSNADAIGYCPTLKAVYEEVIELLADPEGGYVGIADQDAYFPGDIPGGEVYKYLGADTYNAYEEAYKRIKSGTDDEEPNTSGYILLGIIGFVAITITCSVIYINKKEKTLSSKN